jgi:dTDP-4-amino-4,6-dideoxygalactose transaminase
MIPRLRPYVDHREIAALFGASGDAVERFEAAFAAKFGARHGIAFPYGRSVLLALLKAFGCEGREVVLPAYTCSVVAHAVVLSGNIPRFVDIRDSDCNMDLDLLAAALNEKTCMVVATHLYGYPMNVQRLEEIVRDAERRFGTRIRIIQDCAHSFGAEYQGQAVCNAGDAALFGLNISKLMTSIFGGMLTTDDDGIAATLRAWRDSHFRMPAARKHVTRRLYLLAACAAFTGPLYGLVHWLQESTSTLDRYIKAYHLDDKIHLPPDHLERMLPVEARVGIIQLEKYDEIIARRRSAAERYNVLLHGRIPWPLPPLVPGATYSHYAMRVPNQATVMEAMAKRGIQVGRLIEYSMPHLPSYRSYTAGQEYPVSLACSQSMINLPIHASLRDDDLQRIADSMIEVVAALS